MIYNFIRDAYKSQSTKPNTIQSVINFTVEYQNIMAQSGQYKVFGDRMKHNISIKVKIWSSKLIKC